ncbi:Zinc finger protein 160 [Amphibalanus amphitrite]|uniref:Zinc finger protein 160 n=1 Tax=Amphibalanus amphitrite TaxID=1232801 RepID=A0A6A4X2G5_AMPAM|nr:Zinc finger protein 160 [Amphibalanus amphitrite]
MLLKGDAIAGLRCSVCHKIFKNRDSLRKHRALHEGRTVCHVMAGLRCSVCQKTFKSRDSLRHHRALHEGRTICVPCHVMAGLRCSICQKTFKSRDSFRHHRALHEGRTICGAALGGWMTRGSAARGFPCALCGKTHALRTSLTHHMGLHRGETRCPVCQKVFSRKGVAYLSDAPAAAAYPVYRRAVSTGHVGARPGSPSGFFVCTEPGCGMRLRSQPRLSEHRSWHRGETTCHVCGRRFSSKHSMWKHAAHKHGSLMPPSAATRRFGAGVGVITGVQDPVSDHQRTAVSDVGFLCPIAGCGLRLRSQPRLSEHLSWHRGETKCPVCGLRLSSKTKLRNHLPRHGAAGDGWIL